MAGKFTRVSFLFKSTNVYDALFLKERVPTFFVGCSATILKIIEKKAIPQDQYWFASYTEKGGYKECSAEYKARRLLIKADWVQANVPGFGSTAAAAAPAPAAPAPVNKVYPPAPSLLFLADHEKFVDEDGGVVEIEVRGERRHDAIWFKARDVESMIDLNDISCILTKSTSNYEAGKHYQTFHLKHYPSSGRVAKSDTSMFLSHEGLMMLLHRRRHPIADKFRAWASEKLFTIRHGTSEAKEELAAELLQMTPRILRAALSASSTAISAVYLFALGKVRDLRSTFDIPDSFPDDHTVYKFGMTEDLHARTQQHEMHYGKMPGVKLICTKYSAIDPNHLSVAESDIKLFFEELELRLPHKSFRELAVVGDRDLKKTVFREFKELGNKYAGRLAPLKQEVDRLTEKLALQEAHSARIEEIYQQNLAMHQEMQRKAEANQAKMDELYKALLQQKDEALALYRTLGAGRPHPM